MADVRRENIRSQSVVTHTSLYVKSSIIKGRTLMIIDKNPTALDILNDIHLRILDAGHAIMASYWVGDVKSPMYARLYFIIGGDPYVIIDGKKKPLEVGNCYVFPTGFSFRFACDTKMEQLYFHIKLTDFNGNDLLRTRKDVMEFTPADGHIEKMLEYFRSEDVRSILKLRQDIYTSLLVMFEKYETKLTATHYSRCVTAAVKYIKSHLTLQLGIEELAANAFVSESTLAKKFKQEVGMTVGSYIDNMIMFEAEQLLLKTDLTVLQISERFGFCDQFYFSRKFKQKYGETPQKYRKERVI